MKMPKHEKHSKLRELSLESRTFRICEFLLLHLGNSSPRLCQRHRAMQVEAALLLFLDAHSHTSESFRASELIEKLKRIVYAEPPLRKKEKLIIMCGIAAREIHSKYFHFFTRPLNSVVLNVLRVLVLLCSWSFAYFIPRA